MTPDRRRLILGAAALALPGCATRPPSVPGQTVWTFDRLKDIGGAPTTVQGDPRIVPSPFGPAVQFDGVDDVLYVERHPLAGAPAVTFEALFRPDGGAFEQRWFHLAEAGPVRPEQTRILFEIRVRDGRWWLDAFARGAAYRVTLINETKTHPVGRWAHVAQTADGTTYRCFVNRVLQVEAPMAFTPQGPGRASVGARMDPRDFFKGAVREARFTPAALPPERFTIPRALRPA
jgi:hypothetical protein